MDSGVKVSVAVFVGREVAEGTFVKVDEAVGVSGFVGDDFNIGMVVGKNLSVNVGEASGAGMAHPPATIMSITE